MANRPGIIRKLLVEKPSMDIRSAFEIRSVKMCHPSEGEICIKNRYVGINATDVLLSAGRYFEKVEAPFDAGFEGVGEVSSVGIGVTNFKVGDAVAYLTTKHNAFSEFSCISVKDAFPIPEVKPDYLVLVISGLTSSIALDKVGRLKSDEKVLITAAAGGTGHIAVQLAKADNCHVIGTCSTKEKEKILQALGCNTIINYKQENLAEVLAEEYPNGIDVVWETTGGNIFDACLQNLAVKGRLLIIGGTSGYKDGNGSLPSTDFLRLSETIFLKSAAVQGFLLPLFSEYYATYYKYLLERFHSGKIRTICDFGNGKELVGLEGIIDGIEYLHSRKSIGKVMVKI